MEYANSFNNQLLNMENVKAMNKILTLGVAVVLFLISSCSNLDSVFKKEDWKTIGRGEINWDKTSVKLQNCFIVSNKQIEEGAYEFSFKAKAIGEDSEVQIWSGFGFNNRDNRYSLGLRGGNSNDIFLSKYQDGGNTMLLSHEALDFQPALNEWYKFRIVFWEGNIRVYLNDEEKPRIAVKDLNPINTASFVLGGAWTENEYKSFQVKSISKEVVNSYQKDSVQYATILSLNEKESIRIDQRKNYKPVVIDKLINQRIEVSLNGEWLFMPENNISSLNEAIAISSKDENWHLINVPTMWKPVKNWLHGYNRGVSDNFEKLEKDRCENYTFDYENSRGGYYRHWVYFPKEINNKKVFIDFSAVAKVAEVWINGVRVGKHIGMFGDFNFDISNFIHEGKNLIAVKVNDDISEKKMDGDEIETVAITVEVTKNMLNSMAKGMYYEDAVGIWQEVKLIISNDVYIDNVFAKTKLNNADLDITLANKGIDQQVEISAEIFDKKSNETLFKAENKKVSLLSNQNSKITISTGNVNAKLWSPKEPNLYSMKINVIQNGNIIDELIEDIGFRTIEVKGNRFYLNGKSYWLQGANHPPIGIAPNDEKLANTFFKLMHDNNQMVTRTHGTSITKVWADAANKQGVGISAEGTWPWVMLGKDMPPIYLLDLWKKEMVAIVKKYRNNPSILFWTLSNESYFTNSYHKESTQELKMKKWEVLSGLTKEIREIDPTRPISSTSGYIRYQPDYEEVLKPAGIDDGDFDDSHNSYFGWYNPDHFYLYDGKWTKEFYLSTGANLNRPFITQELSTGYPNNDTGHPTRDYIFKHHVPQAWVGDWAYEDHNPEYYLQRNAYLTKEIGEVIRRTSPNGAGVMHFANICWYRNVYNSDKIESYPVVSSMKKALSPVLISAELFGRNFYSGTSFDTKVCIVNDLENGNALEQGVLKWSIDFENETLSEGSLSTNKIEHYGREWNKIKINLPNTLPIDKAYCKLKFSLWIKDKKITENEYDLLLSNSNWVASKIESSKIIKLFDPMGSTKKVLTHLKVPFSEIDNLDAINADLLIVANLDGFENEPLKMQNIKEFARNGGKVLLIHPGNHIISLFPAKIESIFDKPGRIVNMHIPESNAFNNIEPLELSWWQPSNDIYPTACKRSYRLKEGLNENKLATFIEVHSYLGGNRGEKLNEMSGAPLVQFEIEKGIIIASEMDLNIGWKDPISGKVLSNIIEMLLK